MKKGQIAVFIIMGFVILIGISLIIYMRNIDAEDIISSVSQTQEFSIQDDPIKVYVNECIKQVAVESAFVFGFQQGFYMEPDLYIDANNSNIAYFYYKGNDITPSNKLFEEEFSKIMEEELFFKCTDFSIFEDIGYEIKFNTIDVETTILEENVILNIEFPLTIIKEYISEISRFSYALPFRVGHIINISRELVNAVVKEPYALDLTLILNQDVDVSVFNYNECNQVYIILDNESKILPNDADYVFSFAVGFENQYCTGFSGNESGFEISTPKRGNSNPILKPIPYLTALHNQEFTFTLSAHDPDGDTPFYHTTGLVKNHTHILTGLINFTPSGLDVGIHSINVSVIDLRGGLDEKQFYLEVK